MFIVNTPPFPYKDPWGSPLVDRLNVLAKGQQSVAYYYDYPDNSTFRYRVYNMIQALRESPKDISASYFSFKDLNHLDQVVDMADVLVICRARYNHQLNQAITKAKNKGKPVIFDVDDLVFNPDFTHLIVDTLAEDMNNPNCWDFWFGYIGRQNATLSLCDRAITTNAYLAAILADYSGKPVSVIPNFINREQLELSDRIYLEKKASGFARNERIHIGYFSGSPSHNKDLEIAADALAALLAENPRLDLRVVGFVHVKPPLDQFAGRITAYKLQDFLNLQRLIGEVEINLVPLQDNIFTNCKSELKYFEAGIVGTLTIASPIYTYSLAIRDGKNGYLARSFEWYEKISLLLDNMKDDYALMAEQARNDSVQKFAWYNQTELIEKTLFTEPVESESPPLPPTTKIPPESP